MSQDSAGHSCSAYAIDDNVRLGGSRFLGAIELSGRQGRVSMSGRRVPVWWLWARWMLHFALALSDFLWELWPPDKESPDSQSMSLRNTATVSWLAGQSEFVGKYTSCVDGSLLGRRFFMGRHRAQLLPAADMKGPYVVLQVKVPIGGRGSLRLLQLEAPADREQRLRRVLSGVGP